MTEQNDSQTDAWARRDPVLNEGTRVDGRIVLELQKISDLAAKVWCCSA
jgi:hypothetical protein